MASFMTELFGSIFTPGTTPTLLLATNGTFACLQLVLALLLWATRSVHFVVLSFLCGGLWWAINWFASEMAAAVEAEVMAKEKEKEGQHSHDRQGGRGEEAEPEPDVTATGTGTGSARTDASLRVKRQSLGASTDLSTEDEWEKVSDDSGKGS